MGCSVEIIIYFHLVHVIWAENTMAWVFVIPFMKLSMIGTTFEVFQECVKKIFTFFFTNDRGKIFYVVTSISSSKNIPESNY